MKKIRIFCAAMTIAVIGTFGGVALAADNTLKDVDNNTQQKLPALQMARWLRLSSRRCRLQC